MFLFIKLSLVVFVSMLFYRSVVSYSISARNSITKRSIRHVTATHTSLYQSPSATTTAAASTKAPVKINSYQDSKKLFDNTDCFIFDCDGVIWKGDSLIAGVPAVLDKLREMGKMIFFVTNNSTKSRKGYLKKFTSLGLSVKPEGILYMPMYQH